LSELLKPDRKAIRAFPLRRMARSIAANYGDKGAVVVAFGEEGIRIGVENLTPIELRETLCAAIHYSYVFEGGSEPSS